MGLDLYHKKAVIEPINPDDFFVLEDLPDDALAVYGLEKYVQDVPDVELLHSVRFLPDTWSYNLAVSRRELDFPSKQVTFLIGEPSQCEDELLAIEKSLGLNRAQAWFSSCRRVAEGREVKEKFAMYSRDTTTKGIYYETVGYQRKGMSERFYKEYKNYTYLDWPHFRRLSKYLDREMRSQLLPNILANFIQNYEVGRSVLCVST